MDAERTTDRATDWDAEFDWAPLEARFPGRPAFVTRLLEAMRVSNADRPAQLRLAAAAGDLERVRLIAHGVKGTAGNLKLNGLSDLAARTEAAARSGDDSTPRLACALADRLGVLVSLLERRIKREGEMQ